MTVARPAGRPRLTRDQVVALVMVALTFGPAGKLGIKAPGGLELDLDFDKQDAPPREGDPS